jgi:hypothetical protein
MRQLMAWRDVSPGLGRGCEAEAVDQLPHYLGQQLTGYFWQQYFRVLAEKYCS